MQSTRRRRQLLVVNSTNISPLWHNVQRVEMIEIIGGHLSDMFIVEIDDSTRNDKPPPYMLNGGKREHYVNIPRGRIRLRRAKGSNPVTIYAISGR
jgi:hypothetical protein